MVVLCFGTVVLQAECAPVGDIVCIVVLLSSLLTRLLCVAGRDVIAQAQSGTGKTATFSVAILEKIDLRVTKCQALVLAPTRELAQQVGTPCFSLCPVFTVLCF